MGIELRVKVKISCSSNHPQPSLFKERSFLGDGLLHKLTQAISCLKDSECLQVKAFSKAYSSTLIFCLIQCPSAIHRKVVVLPPITQLPLTQLLCSCGLRD